MRLRPALLVTSLAFAFAVTFALGQTSPNRQPNPSDAPKRSITEKDLFDFVWIGDPQVSPDGSRVAFVRVTVDQKRTGYETSIWTVGTAGNEPAVRMTNGKHDVEPRWSPDGRRIAFVRAEEKPGRPEERQGEAAKPVPQIAILPPAGGEAWTITDLAKGATNPVWSPDGKRITFLSITTPEDTAKYLRLKQRAKPSATAPGEESKKNTAEPREVEPESEHESDVHLITRAVYRSNDHGYLDPKRHEHLWVVDVPTTSDELTTPKQLTTGMFNEDEPLWAPDGSRIYFITTRIDEPYYELPTTDIFAVPSTGGDLQKIATVPMDISDVALSADGRRLAFHGAITQPVRSYSQPDLWVLEIGSGAKPRNLTANYDFEIGSRVFGDNLAPRGAGGPTLHWSADGKSLYDVTAKQGRSPLVRVDAESGAVTEITHGNQAVMGFSTTPDARTVVGLVSTPTMVGDLFVFGEGGSQRKITDVNKNLWSQLNLATPEEFTYTSFDGKKIQAWIQKPPDFQPGQKYPLILNIHGGPHAAYGWVFDHEFQWMAAKGYVVLYPNPRGSTSYGQDFGNIIQYRYPGDDYRDLMIGVDEVVKRGYIDPKKLGVTGGSGGGVLTNWIITHTDRFAAAVSQRDISNWASWWYTADFVLFQPNWFKAPPFQDPQEYVNRSAITFVNNIHTPVMFVLGQVDYRTPPDSGGEQLFRALKFLKRPTAMVIFPRESHELSRSGEPWHRIERLEHIVNWFDKWMMGGSHPEYDVRPEKQVDKPTEAPPKP